MVTKKSSVSSKVKEKGNSSNNSVVLTAILILVVFQLIILFGILLTQGEKIDTIETKVSAIDNFFATNVDGYNGNSVAAPSGAGQAAAPTPSIDPSEIDLEGEPTKGDPDAPVTIVEYSDYECPFCGRFFSEAYPQLIEEYVETGKVKFVFKDYPLPFHSQAAPASIAANCVQAQLGDEVYFEFHDLVFENQRAGLSDANLKEWALEVGVDEDEFDTCIEDPEMAAEVQADLEEGSSLGVTGTPSFFINGNLIVGAQPYSVIKQAIEAELQ